MQGTGTEKSIGLCLSGGGHRASIFALGALLYLVDAGRKDDVRAISSVSGGSLTSGFLAAQPKSLHDMKRAEFENCAAKWARQIAGSPAWWRAVMAMWVAFLLVWVLLICAGWGWWPWLARIIRPPWWETQLLYLAAVCVWARIVGIRPGGTFWGWWGTWLYLGVAGPVFLLPILVWWSPFSWWSRILTAFLAAVGFGYVFAQRNRVADLAFRATVCGGERLRNVHVVPRHIFCATEMQTGKYAVLSRNFLYSPDAGVGEPADLPLSAAVQMSANFPVAFPYRILHLAGHGFKLVGSFRLLSQILPRLILSDGGVHDNTGVGYFLDAPTREARLRESLRRSLAVTPESLPEPVRQRVDRQLVELGERPDLLIVVNSSFPPAWRGSRFHTIPVVGEIAALLRVQGAMYDDHGREQCRELHRLFFERSQEGALVSIEQHPDRLHSLFRNRGRDEEGLEDTLRDLGLPGLSKALIEYYGQRADAVIDRQVFGPDYKTELERSAERRRLLDERLRQLQAQKAQAPSMLAEAKLDMEIDKCEIELRGLPDVEFRRVRREMERLDEYRDESKETASSWSVPTTFRPLGLRATSELLRHGYLNCMNMCYLLVGGFPRFDDPPTTKELEQLACGTPRNRYPTLSDN